MSRPEDLMSYGSSKSTQVKPAVDVDDFAG
jgi:hypothetical protein